MKLVFIVFVLLTLALYSNAKTITIVIEVPEDTAIITENVTEFPLIFNRQVEKWLKYYVTKARDYFAKKLWESGKYCAMMKKIFIENGLPPDLVYLALVESGFNPYAYSPAHAVGVWQFTKPTGKSYGLNQNHWIDERRDIEKSTYAAARILKALYDKFGSWALAIAAYNCGSNGLKQAIKNHATTDFWTLLLPAETMVFVPKVIAAVMIARDPESYGFSSKTKPAHSFEVIDVAGCIDLNIIAKCCGVSLEEITILNPELTRQCTPEQQNEYPLKIPEGTKNAFLQNFEKLSDKEKYLSQEEIFRRKGGWVIYTIKKGDTLGGIARKFKTTVENIKKWNSHIRRKYIYPGDKLKVFQRG